VTAATQDDVAVAQELLKETAIDEKVFEAGLALVQRLDIDSHRAEFTMFEAARAHAAADNRTIATMDDLRVVAPMALRQRRSPFMVNFFSQQEEEDNKIQAIINDVTEDKA
ncbi:MAG: magnesium chelatase, partial [Chloroflexota bacterium]